MRSSFLKIIGGALSTGCLLVVCAAEPDLEKQFQSPPDSARPRTWWHWVSGNVSSEGITADLTAMKEIGLGGCQLFTVDQSEVHGPVKFMSPEWRGFVKQALAKADQLGLEVSIEGCDGWSESGGPWIQPEQGMQHVVWTEKNVTGGATISLDLPQPPATRGFYKDIALLAFPALKSEVLPLTGARKDQLQTLTGMRPKLNIPFTATPLTPGEAIDPSKIVDLTGKSAWDAPPGQWTLVRIGHTGTGATTHPSTTPGLECDKLSRAAVRFHLEHMYGPIFEDSPNEAGRALRYILLDSWECGCANWTPLMPQEFSKRRGYEITRWLPVLTGRAVKDADSTQKFLWDFRRTIADLLAENHYGTTREFAQEHHMGLYAEAPGIGLPTVADNLACKGQTDIPMGEFWLNNSMENNIDDPKEAASAAHIYGKPIVATESFTATANVASWANDPYGLKQLGDFEFCLGVNRFVFHRYAHQPWNDRQPGMSMGPWGINFERSNTWWKQGSAWINYLTRCQSLLQQGRFVADLLYFYGEGATTGFAHRDLSPPTPPGFDYDACNAEILLNQSSVENGELVLKSGMRYRVLVLPNTDRMTLAMLKKIQSLVRAGATVYGPRPMKSPTLLDSDAAVEKLSAELWGDSDGVKQLFSRYGKGRVFCSSILGEPLLPTLEVAPDFSASQPGMRFIHRRAGDADIYFVSSQRKAARTVDCTFRVSGKVPEFWHSDSGRMEIAALYRITNGSTTVPIPFDPVGSVFVVFRNAAPADHAVALSLDGKPQLSPRVTNSTIEIRKATFGVPGNAAKSRDATAEIRRYVAAGMDTIPVGDLLAGGDPAYGVVKTLTVDYAINGHAQSASALEGQEVTIAEPLAQSFDSAALWRQADGALYLQAFVPGIYEATLASGKRLSATVANLPAAQPVEGAWQLSFPPKLGAPATATFDHLMSWTESPDEGVKYFSGTAIYRKSIEITAGDFGAGRKIFLDLGTVKNLATVLVNGKSLGTLWKEPFRVDITDAAKPGANELEIQVVNLWPNRLIGDQKLPASERITWASVRPYKAGDPLLPSGLIGPVRIQVAQQAALDHSP